MKLIEFPDQTTTFAKDQPQYRPLPAHQHKSNEEQGRITCCWELSWKERLSVLFGGKIWHSVLTFNHPLQPQLLTTKKPEMD